MRNLSFDFCDVGASDCETPEMQARDYQVSAANNVEASWPGSKGALVRLATGTGKTFASSLIIEKWLARGENYRAIVIDVERQRIWQYAEAIESMLGIKPGIEMGFNRASTADRLVVACRASLAVKKKDGEKVSRLYKFDNAYNWLVVCDEAHLWSLGLKSVAPIIEWFDGNPHSRRVGLTATPKRGDGKSLEALFPVVASDYRLWSSSGECAIKDGWAVDYDQRFIVVEGVDFKSFKKVAGDYTDKELAEIFGKREELSKLINPTLDIVGDLSTLIFSPTVAMARAVALQINADLGYEAAKSVDGRLPEEVRNPIYDGHKRGDFQFLSVCSLCRIGYDDPSLGAVAIFRPTKSETLAEQMKGRVCRTLRGLVDGLPTAEQRLEAIANSTKPVGIVIDLVGISGLADCATTASIFAEDETDEVIEWANDLMLAGETNARVALDQATKEVEEEKRKQAIAARKEREAIERLEAERLARIEVRVKYSQRKVGRGKAVAVVQNPMGANFATPKQQKFLKWKKIPFDPNYLSKKQASRIIGQVMSGKSVKWVKKNNRTFPSKKKAAESLHF